MVPITRVCGWYRLIQRRCGSIASVWQGRRRLPPNRRLDRDVHPVGAQLATGSIDLGSPCVTDRHVGPVGPQLVGEVGDPPW